MKLKEEGILNKKTDRFVQLVKKSKITVLTKEEIIELNNLKDYINASTQLKIDSNGKPSQCKEGIL